MAVSASQVMTIIKFLNGKLEDVEAAYSKDDLIDLQKEIKLISDMLKRAMKIESKDLDDMLEEHEVAKDLQEVKEMLENKNYCPVALSILAHGYDENNDKSEFKYDSGDEYFTLTQCLEHAADDPIRDTMKITGAMAKSDTANSVNMALETASNVSDMAGKFFASTIGLAWGSAGATPKSATGTATADSDYGMAGKLTSLCTTTVGLAYGAKNVSQYSSHKQDVSNRLSGLCKNVKRIHGAMDTIINMLNFEQGSRRGQ